ncbi:hypothetical protein [Actinomadura sp. 3N407]|uniref:hypothetical protein n=1 Tax=Actinomadura sp. 3N407 TaxID=3457423 RepID=UPI003FCDF5AF
MIVSAPVPELAIDDTAAAITGVRFEHTHPCYRCRTTLHLFTDGGRIAMGLRVSVSGKTVRWYERHYPGARPTLPDTCEHCGHATPLAFPYRVPPGHSLVQGCPVANAMPLKNRVWRHLRATTPGLCERADHHHTLINF